MCRQKNSANRLTNPGFNGDSTGWMLDRGDFRANTDADNCTGSGSIEVRQTGAQFWQCVPTNTTSPTHFYFKYRYKNWDFTGGQASSGNSWCTMHFISGGASCDFNNVSSSTPGESSQSDGLTWVQGETTA